jgi:Secretion system C-terminal sorting domain
MRKLYNSLKLFLVVMLLAVQSSSAQTIVYNQAFVGGVTPTTQCTAWTTFVSSLLSTYSYTGFTISGTMDPVGISCNDPVIALAVANALRTYTAYSVFDATATPTPQTWYVGTGCITGSGCDPTGVELSNQSPCLCGGGFSVRPHIGNSNWGGIAGAPCPPSSQTMIVTFRAGASPPTFTGATRYCVGGTITLTAVTSAPSPTFTWTGPSAFTATTATITIPATPATAGIYSCTVTSGGTTSSPGFDTVYVDPIPAVTLGSTQAVCQRATSTTLTYSSPISTPTTYNIVYSPAALAAGFTNVATTPLPVSPITLAVPAVAPAGVYTGTLTVANTLCTGASGTFTVTVNPTPTAISGSTNICTGSTVTLSSTPAGGVWVSSNPAVATIGSSTGLVTGIVIGASTISYTLPVTGCNTSTVINVVGLSGPNHVCQSDSILVSATSPGGLWTSSNPSIARIGTAPGQILGLSMGVVQINYTVSSGCTAHMDVTVNPVAPIEGRDSVCVGGVGWLTNIVGGGTWTSQYPTIATVHLDSGRINGIIAGITAMSYTTAEGCLSTTQYSVIDYPTPITGTKIACPGTSAALSDAVAGGRWHTTNAGVATVDTNSGVFTGVYADTVDITYTIEPGCTIYTRVTVNPLPAPIKGIDVLCPNTNDTLHGSPYGGVWSSTPSSVVAIDTGGVVYALSNGVSTIKYTLPTGCLRTKTISVNPLPSPPIMYNFLTGELYTDTGFVTYQWYDSLAGKIHGATSPSVAAVNTEFYFVEVTDRNGCVGRSPKYYFDVVRLGIKNLNGTPILIYPNPATSVLFIEASTAVKVVVTGIEGKKEIDHPNFAAGINEINISKLAPGMHVITIYDENGTRIGTRNFVKQ